MGMHISLPGELENMVKERVESGLYGSASEVVRAALRRFFHLSEESALSPAEAERIRRIVAPRMKALREGRAALHDADDVFRDIDREYFE